MAFDVDIEVQGDETVVANIQLAADELTSELEQIIARYALRIAGDAKKNAPVDTGRLRASIVPVLEDMAATIAAGGSVVGSFVDYAKVQEFGTENMQGRKYLTRAFNKHKDAFRREIEQALADMGS